MRWLNRAKLLWGYLATAETLPDCPVEYIVETTAKCNLYCPMCPRETHKQPKEDMTDEIFDRLVQESGSTAEHMMLIGLGEPFLDRKIFDRIEYCDQHGISTLLSTNGTLLDEKASARLLDTPLEHITLSFDGATKESFEYYRKGARFEKVRDNFVRFARMKQERGSRYADRGADGPHGAQRGRGGRFRALLERGAGRGPGADQGRRNQPDAAGRGTRAPSDWKHPCHYLWRGPMYVKHNGDVYPCCQSYMLDGAPVGNIGEQPLETIWNSDEMQRMRRLHVEGRAGEIDICSRCCTTIPHPLLVAGSLLVHGKWVRKALPLIERFTYRSKLPKLLTPPAKDARRSELVQIAEKK